MLIRIKTLFLTVITYFLFSMYFLLVLSPNSYPKQAFKSYFKSQFDYDDRVVITSHHEHGKWRLLYESQMTSLSRLGRILYLDEQPPKTFTVEKHYTILIWKYNCDRYKGLYPKELGLRDQYNFDNCAMKNCHVTHSESDLPTADIVIFNLHALEHVNDIPVVKERPPKQIWAFFNIESPINPSAQVPLDNLGGLFNWSMTYKMESDIPVPYGRTRLLRRNEKLDLLRFKKWNANKKQDVLIAIISSNCRANSKRGRFIAKLQKLTPIDIYGSCGTLKCESDNSSMEEGRAANDCNEISKYKFYLAFENANCDEYITEKLWWYAYSKNAIPIVMGGSRRCYEQMLPPQSYLHVEAFAHPRDIVEYILYLNRTNNDLRQYFWWKMYFKVVNEHGYFGTDLVRYCRICEALNYNSKEPKVYKDLIEFFNLDKCY